MLVLLPLWLLLLAMLVGWGLFVLWLLRRGGGPAFGGALSLFQTMWLGYTALVTFLVFCSFLFPIAELVLALTFVPAVAGFALQRKAVLQRARSLRHHRRLLAVIAAVTLVTWLVAAVSACDAITWYDTGLYHLEIVEWSTTFPVVKGLANLHGRLGYNNTVHLFAALTDTFWQGVAVHIMNGFFIACVLGQWIVEIFTAGTPRGRVRQTYCLLTLPFLLAKLWSVEIASLSTDLPLAILCLVLGLELLSLQRGLPRRLVDLAFVLALAATATTTKLGGLGLFAVTGVLALVFVVRGVSWRARVAVFAIPVLLVIGWFARGLILSGWMIFPVFGRIGFPWAVRHKVAADHLRWIESWARIMFKTPAEVLDHGFAHWFVPWFEQFRNLKEAMLLCGSGILLAWRAAFVPPPSAVWRVGSWAAFLACALGLLQWFVGAPDMRFGGFLFWMMPAILFTPLVAGSMREVTTRTTMLAGIIGMCIWSGGLTPRVAVVPPLFDRPVDPAVPGIKHVTAGPGTDLITPVEGDQCWSAGLLCTPYPGITTFRHASSIGAGFLPGPPRL